MKGKVSITKPVPLWIKAGQPIWIENRNPQTKDIIDYLKGFIASVEGSKVKADIPSKNQQLLVDFEQVLQRQLEHSAVHDLSEIPLLNDAELMAYFNLLYVQDTINVYCGPSLIVINPNKRIPKEVSPQTLALIQSCYEKNQLDMAPPHVWKVAASGLHLLRNTGRNQAVCINGESGAGKTVSTKLCLQFLTSLDAKKFERDGEDLASMIMACNPVLEAFGNAKTNRNDNSSRFGKYVKLFYQIGGDAKILGATTENYLLEKIRVVDPSKNERTFHIFYAMLRFMPTQKLQKYYLQNDPSQYEILRRSGTYSSDKIDDKEFYEEVMSAFERLHFSEEQQDSIWRILATILFLGNLKIDSSNYVDEQVPCNIIRDQNWKNIVNLLEVDENQLEGALVSKKRKLGGKLTSSPYTPQNIPGFILSLAKDLYDKMFNWIVKKMNIILKGNLDIKFIENIREPLPDDIRTIGILDIFGFEIFENNYLEQLFINYANERLQGLYIDHIFKNEVKFFKAEGLEKQVENITYEDNLGLINLLDSNKGMVGIFPMTNEQAVMNKSDQELMEKMKTVFEQKGKEYIWFHRMNKNKFYVNHTAREVEYNINGFIEKNKDEIPSAITKVIYSSKQSIVKIYQQIIDDKDIAIFDSSVQKSSKDKFLGYKFTSNMNELVFQLTNSNLHFIRCVKPNELKKENFWDFELVLKQITYMGILNSLLIRKKNYVFRYDFEDFYIRYQDLDSGKEGGMSPHQLKQTQPNWRQLVQNILDQLDPPALEKDLLFGKTKVLIQDQYKQILDQILTKKQIKKREALQLISKTYQDFVLKGKVDVYFGTFGRSLQIAKGVLTGIKAKVEYVNFKKKLKTINKVQNQFLKIQNQRENNLIRFKTAFLMKFFKFQMVTEQIRHVLRVHYTFDMIGQRLKFLLFRARRRICARILEDIFELTWTEAKKKITGNSGEEIQRTFRSFLLRKQMGPQIANLRQRVKETIRYQAVVRIQATARRFLVLRRMERVQTAARTIQRYFKTYWLSNYFKKMVRSAVIIQRFMRKHQARKRAMKLQFQQVITNSGKTLEEVIRLEYEELFGQKSFFDGQKNDFYYQNYLEKRKFESERCMKMIPRTNIIDLKKRAKLFSLVIDFNTKTDTSNNYNKSWAHSFWKVFNQLQNEEERIIQFNISENSSFIVTDSLKVYSWGNNSFNQLARKTDYHYCQDAVEVQNFSKNKPQLLVLGKNRGQMLCQNESLITWGQRFGVNSSDDRDSLLVNETEEKIINIVNQNNDTYVLTGKGDVKQWPVLNYDFHSRISFEFSNQKIRSISAGNDFIIMVSDSEQVFSYGNNQFGQLGLNHTQNRPSPQLIPFFTKHNNKVKEVSCGFKHVLLRTSLGIVYSWGDNSLYQLGQLSETHIVTSPKKIAFSKLSKFRINIRSIVCGSFCSFFLDKSNLMYFCGETGLGTFYSLKSFPYQEKYFGPKMGDKFIPLRLKASWSRTKSLIYLQLLDFRETGITQQLVKQKVGKLYLKNWKQNDLYPEYSDYLTNFIQTKNFLQYYKRGLVDVTLPGGKSQQASDFGLHRQTTQSQEPAEKQERETGKYDLYEDDRRIPVQNIWLDEFNNIVQTKEDKITKRRIKQIQQHTKEEVELDQKNKQLMDILLQRQSQVQKINPQRKQSGILPLNPIPTQVKAYIPKEKSTSVKKREPSKEKVKQAQQVNQTAPINPSKNIAREKSPIQKNNQTQQVGYRKSIISFQEESKIQEDPDNVFLKKNKNKKEKESRSDSRKKDTFSQKFQENNSSQRKSNARIKDPKILEKVTEIMKKDPKTWTKVQKELVNNYVRLTQGYFDAEN